MDKLTNIKGKLLEGCVWEEKEEKLYFVDIECRKIYCFSPEKKTLDEMEMQDYVSCLVVEGKGTLIAALRDGLYRVNYRDQTSQKIMTSGLPEGLRFNDGKCDARGRLWIGSMAIEQNEQAEGVGSLFCIAGEKVIETYPGYTIPNGLAWDAKGVYFYHIDTPKRRVDRYLISGKAQIVGRETVVDLSEEEGSPDGMCMDSIGRLWIAMWGGGKVLCVNTETREKEDEIKVPDKYTSCCTFGGTQLNQLFITTARDECGGGGELYVQQMKVKGAAANRYGG